MACRYRKSLALILSVFFLSYAGADAAEFVLQPDAANGKDSWVGSAAPTTTHGSESYLYYGGDCTGNEIRLYIQFDLSMVESSSTVDLAQLELYMFSQSGEMDFIYSVYCITEAWSEAALTWNTQPACEGTAAFTFSGTEWQGGYLSWHAITGLAPLVNYWIDNPDQNFGMMIKPASTFYGYPMIWSSDYSNASLRPRLVLEGALVDAESTTFGGVKSLFR